MTLDEDDCWARLARSRHGVLATVHPGRGVDTVPVVFAVIGRDVLVPVDTVKAKSRPGRPLQRLANLERDPRCSLLVDHYDGDWAQLWWVRVHARGTFRSPAAADLDTLAKRFPQYRSPGTVVGVVVLAVTGISGWRAR
jgi:PPOX class probable F420-dependent enzyme